MPVGRCEGAMVTEGVDGGWALGSKGGGGVDGGWESRGRAAGGTDW